tara:strand:- start:19682 stop:20113 length:432 start_codon:yes stop_codon:yes gene_type:complete
MRVNIFILIIINLLSISAKGQNDKVCVERYILEKVANQLDSFEIAKKLQIECSKFVDSSLMVISTQHKLIDNLDIVIANSRKQIKNLQDTEIQYTEILKVNDEYIKSLKKEKKKLKTKYTISLIGGGVFTIGLTTALLISLLQ